jgi:hypothetical protein
MITGSGVPLFPTGSSWQWSWDEGWKLTIKEERGVKVVGMYAGYLTELATYIPWSGPKGYIRHSRIDPNDFERDYQLQPTLDRLEPRDYRIHRTTSD